MRPSPTGSIVTRYTSNVVRLSVRLSVCLSRACPPLTIKLREDVTHVRCNWHSEYEVKQGGKWRAAYRVSHWGHTCYCYNTINIDVFVLLCFCALYFVLY